ncbi:hypothetical protein [Neobacillus drentensis]|jgi:hypothetical protein|uniref:hypothetical protein n=1 Tax=Neobacillus drentensis TaxID=220684 RepID=UPI001596F48D
MDFYHNWLYQSLFNTKWFLWSIVGIVIALNMTGPILVWITMVGKNKSKKTKKET